MSKKDTLKIESGSAGFAPRAAGDDYLGQWQAWRRELAERQERELRTGQATFEVSHPGDPTRLVGAADPNEAIAKYRRYFGILGSSHEFAARPATEPPGDPAGASKALAAA